MQFDIKYKRMSDETLDDFFWRICYNKQIGLYDINWEDVRDILNIEHDESFNESKWRKEFQPQLRGYERAMREGLSSEQQIAELKQATLELEMARKKKQTDTVYYNRVLREHAREEMLKEKVIEAIQKADKIPLPEFKPLQVGGDLKYEWLLGITDIHAYKIFESITNKYSKEILEQRMAELLEEVKALVRSEKLSHITVLNGGDDLEGILRASALSMLELGVIETVVEFRRFIAKWLSMLSEFVEVRYIHLISSNHTEDRPLGTRAGQFPQEDFEIDIATYIHDLLENNERIEVIVPDDVHYHLKIANQDVLCHHGHKIGNPKDYLDSMSRKLKVWFSTLVVGHLHTEELKTFYEDIDGGDVELCRLPSIVGTCKFADSINRGSKSAAVLIRFSENKGRDREYKIVLN